MNVPPNTTTTPQQIRRRNEAATSWLKQNDPIARKQKKLAKLKDRKDLKQAQENPALVASYRRAILRGPQR